MIYHALIWGARGAVSATANIAPRLVVQEGGQINGLFDFDDDGRLDAYLGGSPYPHNKAWLFHQKPKADGDNGARAKQAAASHFVHAGHQLRAGLPRQLFKFLRALEPLEQTHFDGAQRVGKPGGGIDGNRAFFALLLAFLRQSLSTRCSRVKLF